MVQGWHLRMASGLKPARMPGDPRYGQENFDWQVVDPMSPFLTSKENIVVNLIYEWLGESRINRTFDKYMEIASRFPKVEACQRKVRRNAALRFAKRRLQAMLLSKFATLMREISALGSRIFAEISVVAGKLCAVRRPRDRARPSRSTGRQCLRGVTPAGTRPQWRRRTTCSEWCGPTRPPFTRGGKWAQLALTDPGWRPDRRSV